MHSDTNTSYKIDRWLFCSGTNVYQLMDFLRHEEGDTILKGLSYHTMLTTPEGSVHLVEFLISIHLRSSGPEKLNRMPQRSKPQQLNSMVVNPILYPTMAETKLSPAWPTVNSKLIVSQNLQILRTIASGHDVIHTPATFPICGLLWQLWWSYPSCASAKLQPMLCTWN